MTDETVDNVSVAVDGPCDIAGVGLKEHARMESCWVVKTPKLAKQVRMFVTVSYSRVRIVEYL
jgi:hypothetical protein